MFFKSIAGAISGIEKISMRINYKPLVTQMESKEFSRLIPQLISLGAPVHPLSEESKTLSEPMKTFVTKIRDAVLDFLALTFRFKKEDTSLEALIHQAFSPNTQNLVIKEAGDLIARLLARPEMPAQS